MPTASTLPTPQVAAQPARSRIHAATEHCVLPCGIQRPASLACSVAPSEGTRAERGEAALGRVLEGYSRMHARYTIRPWDPASMVWDSAPPHISCRAATDARLQMSSESHHARAASVRLSRDRTFRTLFADVTGHSGHFPDMFPDMLPDIHRVLAAGTAG